MPQDTDPRRPFTNDEPSDERNAASDAGEGGSVPAGGGGADSGAADAVDVSGEAAIPNVSSMNDIPGVGTRGPTGEMDTAADVQDEPAEEDPALEQMKLTGERNAYRDDEDAGAAHHNTRVAERDAGAGGLRNFSDERRQDLPRLAQNAATLEEEVAGIVEQTRADLGVATEEKIRHVLGQRLHDAGISESDADIESMVTKVMGGGKEDTAP